MSKDTASKIQIPQVRYKEELQGERGKKIMRVFKARRKDNPFITTRQVILQLMDAGLEKELNINQ